MEEYQTQPPVQESPKKSKRGFKIFLYVLLMLLVAAATAYGVYAWQQNEVNNLRSEISAIESRNEAPAEKHQEGQDEAKNEKSDDEKVAQAFNDYCAALAVPQGARLAPSISAVTEDQKKIAYSADPTFAAVNANCFTSTDSEQQVGGGSLYMLKKADETWLVILSTQQRPSEEQIRLYAIPEEFLATLGLSR